MKDFLKGLIYVGLFAVPFLTLYVENDFFFPFITGKNFAFRIIVEVVAAAWLILALYDKEYRPRFSWLLASFTALIGVMFLASLAAEHRMTAFFSNYERMDGYVTLIHVYAYFVLLGTMLRTPKQWSYFLHTSVAVAGFVALKGLSQLASADVRVDSTLGNAAYMAIYMLFHIFFLAYLFVQSKVTPYRIVYALLMVLFAYVLLQTGTRGTAIGLATGSLAAVAYVAVYAPSKSTLRRYAIGACAAVVLLIGTFYLVRDTDYVQGNQSLSRIANTDLGSDLRIRTIIWSMAVKGIEEKPVLGWGNGNFNYVFNEQYDPRLYGQEQWFDRVHNIFFDWLIAGGIFGLLAYFSIFAALAYYLLIRPWKKDDTFSALERGVIFGLLVGYLTHNLVVFDNIVSYIFFAVTLGLLHSRYGTEIKRFSNFSMPEKVVTQIALPVTAVVAVLVVYTLNVPSMQASAALINAFETQDLDERLSRFEEALSYKSFARQEVVEQLAQQTMGIADSKARGQQGVSEETFKAYVNLTETELAEMVKNKPNDARLHVFLASYYRSIGNIEKAREQLAISRKLSPKKQAIILQQGAVEYSAGDIEGAKNYFKEAYELDTTNNEAKEFYVASLFASGNKDEAAKLVAESDEVFMKRLAQSDFVVSSVNEAKDYATLASLYEVRVELASTTPQNWASLAFTYYQMKEIEKAVDALERGGAAVPGFSQTASCWIGNLEAGRSPEVGCN